MREKIKQMRVGNKLNLVFGIIIGLYLLSMIAAAIGLGNVGATLSRFYNTSYENTQAQLQMRRDTQSIMKNILWLCVTDDPTKEQSLFEQYESDLASQKAQLEILKGNSNETEFLQELEKEMAAAAVERDKVIELVKNGQKEEALAAFNANYSPAINYVLETLQEAGTLANKNALDNYSDGLSIRTLCFIILAVITVLAVTLTIILKGAVTKSIVEPLAEVEKAAKQLAQGELDISIEYESADELGSLSKCFRITCNGLKTIVGDLNMIVEQFAKGNFDVRSTCKDMYMGSFKPLLEHLVNMVVSVSDVLGKIQSASDQVTAGSDELAKSAQDLAQGASEQSASIEELLATVSDVAEQIAENAHTTDKAHDNAKIVGEEAEISRRKMVELTEAMAKIGETSQEIGKIIADIEDIASQTNLLSLNASIEAARAGEAGRGFAVVADQIGKLAEDSAQSAVKTRNMIEASIHEVERGNTVTEETASSMNKVIDELDSIVMAVADIRAASDRQAASARGIEQGVEEISAVVQNNSAVAQETSATSEELSAQATTLNEQVAKFVLRK